MRRVLVFLMSAVALLPAASPRAQAAPATVVLVRHAEAIADAGTDPGLSEAGIARAAALAEALKDAGIAAVITTQYQRTILTGEPVASAMKAPLVRMRIAGGAAGLDAYVRQVVQRVHASYAGRTVVIIGHSNTVPALVKGLTGVETYDIAHDSYDHMFVVTAHAPGSGTVVRARYGR